MIGLDDLREYALPLPDVTEGTHFRLPSFKVADKGFVTLQKGETHAILGVDESQASAAVARDPDACEPVWRNERIFVGLRVDLARVTGAHVRELVELAWRNKAPKRVVAAYDADHKP